MTTHVKWLGSKAQTAEQIVAAMPAGRRWVEPFCGSARTWLVAQNKYSSGLLADINQDLIDFYANIEKSCESFLDFAEIYFSGKYNSSECFYALRDEFNQEPRGLKRAALFLYLDWHSFNGLVRYNAKGGFNAPFGDYVHAPKLPVDGIRRMADALRNVDLVCESWARTASSFLRSGDIVYCDPPYFPLSKTASFTGYHGQKFTQDQHEGIARAAARLAQRGYSVGVSNADIPVVRALYQSSASKLIEFQVKRSVSAKASSRGKAKELLALYLPIGQL